MLKMAKFTFPPNLVRLAKWEQFSDDYILLPVIIKPVEPVCLRKKKSLVPANCCNYLKTLKV